MTHEPAPKHNQVRTEEAVLSAVLYDRLVPYLMESISIIGSDGRVRAMLGPPGGTLGISDELGRHIFDYCLEEDVPRAMELAVEALGSSPGWSTTWVTRLRKSGGGITNFEVHVENQQDDPLIDGFILRLRELPDRVEADSPIFESELGAELERLGGAVPLPILFLGSDGALYFQNDAARELCGPVMDNVVTDGFGALAASGDRPRLEAAVEELSRSPGERIMTFRLAGEGLPRDLEVRLSGLGRDDDVLAVVATLVDVTDRVAEERELRRRASSDPLTGLLNRSELEDVLARRLALAPEPTTVCYLDLDDFKSVNDSLGHTVGDELLVTVAQILSANVRLGDAVARIGGDEFVLVLGDSGNNVEPIVRRITWLIEEHCQLLDLRVRASIGVAPARIGDTARDLLRRADHAMYEIKRGQRNAT